ncbi:hypothetical protein P9112_005053 [Eukaryota sp. TZLM1-RC]
MRFRSFIWPDNLPHNLICKCSREITTTHLLNCKHFITFRSKVHDAVRDQLYCMCKYHRIESFLEPLLSNLFDAEDDFHKNNRGDVILPGLDGSFILLDVMSVDPCNVSIERLVDSEIHNPLSNAENFKFKQYNEPLSKLASLQHANYNLYPFVFSLFGSLAPTALRFLDDFEMIVKRRTGRNFNRLFWQNAFNSVKRNCIFDVLLHDFPELSAYFYLFYGKKSDLIFDTFALESSSGVKQGDPLGPLLFCLAIHNIIKMTQQDFPDLRIVAYMDDISIIGSFESISRVSEDIAAKYKEIGLALNPSKCLLIGREKQSLMIGGAQIPFINYDQQAFKFLGCWLGNLDEIYSQLNNLLEKFDKDLSFIAECDIEKHIIFFILKICYSGKFTHILRSTPPSVPLNFCRSFNKLRVKFFSSLLEVNESLIRSHVFCSADLGGIGFTKSSILCKAAFLGGGKNFVFEFFQRFPHIFYKILTTIPQVYGTLLSDSAWTLNMRFRSFIWPDNLPHNLICKCSREITTTHLLNCKHFITFRSKVHDAVRDQLYCMCKSHRIESFLEPLLSNLFDTKDDFHKNNRVMLYYLD